MFKHATAIFIFGDDFLATLVEHGNGQLSQRLNLYQFSFRHCEKIELLNSWNTSDRQQLKDAILMFILETYRDRNLSRLLNGLGYKGNQKPKVNDIDLLIEFSMMRKDNLKVIVCVFANSDMVPTIYQQIEGIRRIRNISVQMSIPPRC